MTSLLPCLLLAVAANTKPIYIGDLTHDTPNFLGAPSFSLNDAIYGGQAIGQPKKDERKTKKQRTKELVNLLQDLYPDAEIRVYGDHIIIR